MSTHTQEARCAAERIIHPDRHGAIAHAAACIDMEFATIRQLSEIALKLAALRGRGIGIDLTNSANREAIYSLADQASAIARAEGKA